MGLTIELFKKVKGFTLDVRWNIDNELAVLFGYSGSGKSMTFHCIAGLTEPDRGYVRVNEKVVFDSEEKVVVPAHRRSFGYVFQDLALFPHMRVNGNILYGAPGLDRETQRIRLADMLCRFYLEGLEDKFPSELSGGQKQRVAFARALIGRPEALLLDEPFSSLDAPIRLEMRELLKEVHEAFSIPIILITHDLDEALNLGDTMLVYSGGRVHQQGTPLDILNAPASPEVAHLVHAGSRSAHVAKTFNPKSYLQACRM